MKSKYVSGILLVVVLLTSCLKVDEGNPNAPDEDEVYQNAEGLVRTMVGVKYRFAVTGNYGSSVLFNSLTANGFSTNEIFLRNGANQDFAQLARGADYLGSTNAVLNSLWSGCHLINKETSQLLRDSLTITDPGLRYQFVRYASLYKALALGTLALHWEKFPIVTGENAVFVDRKIGLQAAIDLLKSAALLPVITAVGSTNADLMNILGTEINMRNAIPAISARYYLMLETSQGLDSAIRNAARVDLRSRSVFVFTAQQQNPMYRFGFSNPFAYLPKDQNFGLPPSLYPLTTDLRKKFYLTDMGFAPNDTTSFPVYLPGEMMLIQAEAQLKKGNIGQALVHLNQVLTKLPADDIFKVGGALPPYSGPTDSASLAKEIYKQRCIELYMSGMKKQDGIRFNRPGPRDIAPERNRNYYPYPLQERFSNPNTPSDPDI